MSSYFKVILIFFVHCIMLNHSAIAMQSVEPVTLENQEGNTALTLACKNGHVARAKLLLQTGADPCAWDEDGNLPICFAASFGHIGILDLFAEYYQTDLDSLVRIINQQDNHKRNALMWAAWHGRADIVSFLLDHGADPSLTFELNNRNQERKALDWAYRGKTNILCKNVGQGTLESYNAIIKILTPYKPQQKVPTITTSTSSSLQPTLSENKKNNIALISACKNSQVACARLLLQTGTDPRVSNNDGNLAICFAAGFGCIAILYLFAEYYQTNPDFLTRIINQQDNYQKNALMWAAWYGRADIVSFLLDHGADPSLTFDNKKRKALNWAYKGQTKIRCKTWGYGTLKSYGAIIEMLTSYELQQKIPTITTSTSPSHQATPQLLKGWQHNPYLPVTTECDNSPL